MDIIICVGINVINNGLMNIESYEIRSNEWRHRPAGKRAEDCIDIINTTVVLILLGVLKSFIQEIKADAVPKECGLVLALCNCSMQYRCEVLFQFRIDR